MYKHKQKRGINSELWMYFISLQRIAEDAEVLWMQKGGIGRVSAMDDKEFIGLGYFIDIS